MSDYKTYEVRVYKSRRKEWRLHGKLHREGGPAIERADGDKQWWFHGELHREDGPAIERAGGYKEWWLNGSRHREDGPAVEYSDGSKEWWLYDEELTEEEYRRRTSDQACNGKIVEIDGIKYKLTEV